MPYTAIDIALVVALVFTCGFSFAMLREFRRFKAHAGEYGLALQEASRAMEAVDEALGRTHDEGAQTVISLGERLEAAERLLGKLKTAEAAATAQLMRLRDRIDEAREVLDETQSAFPAAASGERSVAEPGKAVVKNAPGRKAGSGKKALHKTVLQDHPSGPPPGDTAMAPAPRTEHAGTSGALALAPASAAAPQAPRTRKILSWPVIRSTGLAAGGS